MRSLRETRKVGITFLSTFLLAVLLNGQVDGSPGLNGSDASVERRPLVGVSFKMYFDLPKTKSYIDETIALLSANVSKQLTQSADVFVIPDFVTLASTASQIAAANASLLLGAQDVHWQDAGAFTGEVSPKVLSQIGVTFVEIGHAERRRYFYETDACVANKAAAIAKHGMVPLICIGEKKRPSSLSKKGGRVSQKDLKVVVDECWRQVKPALVAMRADADVVLAYEPVWAIGQPEPASPDYVVRITKALRTRYHDEFVRGPAGKRTAASLRILYGGSTGPGLFEKIREGVDGLFLGRFAHQPTAFIETVKEVAATQ